MFARWLGSAVLTLALGVFASHASEDRTAEDARRGRETDALTQPKKNPPTDTRRDAVKDGKKKETKVKGGVAGKVQSVDVSAGKLTLGLEGGKQRAFNVTIDTKFIGPKGGKRGTGKAGLKDAALTVGSAVRVVPAADPKNAAEVHLPVRRKTPEKK